VTTQALPEPWLLALVESLRLAEPNLKVEYHHAIADIDIDILLSVNHKRLAIDLIGFPGDLGAAVHLNRYTTLKRVGIALYPLTAFDWMFNPDTVIDNIQAWLHDKADRLNQQLPVKAENNLVEKITTQPFVTSTPMSLVNEQVWLDFLECAQAPELSPAWGFDISDMVEKLTQMDQLLPKLFKTGSVTYLRYKSAINTALTPYLENLSTYRMLHSQVWEANNTDTGYWQTLTAPILERHEHITEVLTKLHREMQMEVAKGGKADDFALQDIEGLAERLGKY
jgi:hypothetical protein